MVAFMETRQTVRIFSSKLLTQCLDRAWSMILQSILHTSKPVRMNSINSSVQDTTPPYICLTVETCWVDLCTELLIICYLPYLLQKFLTTATEK